MLPVGYFYGSRPRPPVPPTSLGNRKGKPSLDDGHHLHPVGKGLCVPAMRDGHLQQKYTVQCSLKHSGCEFLR